MTTIITAHVVAQFTAGSGEGGILTAEIDSRPQGLNEGKTTFFPGDPFYFLVYKSSDVTIVGTDSSAGSVSGAGSGSISHIEYVVFANEAEANVEHPIASVNNMQWGGNNLGGLSTPGGTTVRIASPGVGILKLGYSAQYSAYKVSNIPADLFADGGDYQVVAVVTGSHP